MSGYYGIDIKINKRIKISIVCFFLAVASGIALLISSQLDSGSPVNYSLHFSSVQNGEYYNVKVTGTVTNRRNVEYPYLDYTVSFNVGGERKTHKIRIEKLGPLEQIKVDLVIETDYTVKPDSSRIDKITTPVKSVEWIVKTISLSILCAALFMLIVPNVVIGVSAVRKKQHLELLKQQAKEKADEEMFVSARRELFLVTSKTGEMNYNFKEELIDAGKREPVPDSALSAVRGVYRLKNYEEIQADRFSLDIDKEIAQELARNFNELETGQEVIVTHMPANGLFGNAVAEIFTRTGRRHLLGFLRLRDVGYLFNRYGGHFSFYGTVAKLNRAEDDSKNKKNKEEKNLTETGPETEETPSVTILLTVPRLTPENRFYSEKEYFYAYDDPGEYDPDADGEYDEEDEEYYDEEDEKYGGDDEEEDDNDEDTDDGEYGDDEDIDK